MANEKKEEKVVATPAPTPQVESVGTLEEDNYYNEETTLPKQQPTPPSAPTAPSEAEQLQSTYVAKQNENRKKEDAIIADQDEERKKAQRKQRNRQIVNSIADGLSAISNIVTTAHGAPDLGVGKTLMTAKAQERYDKLYKDAEDRRKEYLKIVREGNKEDLSNWYTMQKDAMTQRIKERETKVKEAEQKRKELQEKRLQAESEAKILLLNAKADEAEQNAIIAELHAAKTPEEIDLKLQEIRSRIRKNDRSGSSGSGGHNKKVIKAAKYKTDDQGNLLTTSRGAYIPDGYETITVYKGTPEWDYYVNDNGNGGNSSSNNKNNNKGGWSAKNR